MARFAAVRAGLMLLAGLLALAPRGAAADPRVEARSGGSDRATARRIAAALLARPLPAQLLRVRCERVDVPTAARPRSGHHVDCGLVLSGTRFHRTLDLTGWNAEVAGLIAGAYAAAPGVDEVDLWAVVPLDAGRGTVVSGDLAKPTSATVFSLTVPRAERAAAAARLRDGRGVFWDPAFRASLSKGSRE